MPKLRRAGSPWRILVHEWLGAKSPDGIRYGRSYDVSNDPRAPGREAARIARLSALRPDLPPPEALTSYTVLEGTEIDEVVAGRWLHAEQMDTGIWHIAIGGVVVIVAADRDGRPKRVSVHGPGDYDGPADGCTYSLHWTAEDGDA